MSKIIVKGSYGVGNLGDDILYFMFGNLLNQIAEEKKVFYYCTDKKYLRKFNSKYQNINKINEINDYDIFIYGGGTQFASFSNRKKQNLLDKIEHLINPKNTIEYLKFKKLNKMILNKKIIKVGLSLGVGPFSSQYSEDIVKKEFSNLNFIWVRDNISNEFCKKWNTTNNHFLAPDIALAYNFSNVKEKKINTQCPKLGFIPRDWNNTKEGQGHIESMIQYTKKENDNNFESEFYLFKGKKDKSSYFKLKSSQERVWLWNPNKMNINDAMNELNSCDIIISARYHGVLLAIMLGKPVIAVGIEPKLTEAIQIFDQLIPIWKYPYSQEELQSYINTILNSEYTVDEIKKSYENAKNITKNVINEFEVWFNKI